MLGQHCPLLHVLRINILPDSGIRRNDNIVISQDCLKAIRYSEYFISVRPDLTHYLNLHRITIQFFRQC